MPIVLGLVPSVFSGAATAFRDQLMVIAGHVAGIAAGVGMLRGRLWALWVATGMAVMNLSLVGIVLAGVAKPFAGFYQDAAVRLVVF